MTGNMYEVVQCYMRQSLFNVFLYFSNLRTIMEQHILHHLRWIAVYKVFSSIEVTSSTNTKGCNRFKIQ